jgi:hypothetical protein
MANEAAKTQTINIVPVQGIFQPEPTFDLITLIGPAGTPFFAKIDPNQSGLNITNSTINSTTIGATTPSTAAFTSGTVAAAPTAATDIANKQYVATKNTGYYVSNYYSRWSEGRKYVIDRDGKLYTFILYGRPAERESNSDFGVFAFYNNQIELKEQKSEQNSLKI